MRLLHLSAWSNDNATGANLTNDAYAQYIAATVAKNMNGFTKQEVAKAKEARNHLAMLGCSIQNSIKKLPNITNTLVTAQDHTDATTIYWSLLAHLMGKTRHIMNAVVPNPLHKLTR